jgi:membrane protease YdiL (CAAX protease family)
MSDPITKSPLIRQGWLRVLLFGCAFCVITLLIAVPAILTLAGTSPDDLKGNPAQVLTSLLTGQYFWLMLVLEFVISQVSVLIFRTWIDRRKWLDLGWNMEDFAGEAITGLCLGPALLGLAAVIMFLTGHLEWTDIVWDPSSLFISLGWMAMIAFSEELVFRGYILGNLLETFQNKWIALGISAILFSAYHGANPGTHTLAFANLFLAGLLLGINYLYTKNLWFSFLLHLSWNFFQGPILGFKVGGLTFPSLLQAEPKGDLFITGGDFGLEGSMLCTLLLLAAVLILGWAFEKKYGAAAAPPLKA